MGIALEHKFWLIIIQERIICLNGQVDEATSATIVAQLLFLEAEAPDKAISLYINSPGGSVSAGMGSMISRNAPSNQVPQVLPYTTL
jgi:ATP-dependent Clp endopeptidase proteolytic subunit ClpP